MTPPPPGKDGDKPGNAGTGTGFKFSPPRPPAEPKSSDAVPIAPDTIQPVRLKPRVVERSLTPPEAAPPPAATPPPPPELAPLQSLDEVPVGLVRRFGSSIPPQRREESTRGASKPQPPPAPRRPANTSTSSAAVPRMTGTGSGTGTDANSREERVNVSFPGVMKVLIPEKSFIPVPLPVRVANLSSGGAMVEIHDKSKLGKDLQLPNRYFELRVAHPEVPLLRGTIAWSDFAQEKPLLGLACFEKYAELSQLIFNPTNTLQINGPPPLPPIVLEPFPPVVATEEVVLKGHAREAMEVTAKSEDGEQRISVPVRDGHFELTLKLRPGLENHFSLRGSAGQRRTRAVPVQIGYERQTRSRKFYFDVRLATEGDLNSIALEFNGTVRQAERVLYRFSQLMASSERVSIVSTLESPTNFDKRLFEALRSEGAFLAADTGRNEAAAKLLDELL